MIWLVIIARPMNAWPPSSRAAADCLELPVKYVIFHPRGLTDADIIAYRHEMENVMSMYGIKYL
jgi:hypothetical protein